MNSLPAEYLDIGKVSLSFNRAAATYQQWTTIQKTVGDDLLERLIWLKMAPKQILDVGAGTGRLTRFMSQQYKSAHVYAIDIAAQMMRQASQQAPKWFSKQHFFCADAVQLPIADDSIDLLVSNLMLQWCNDIHKMFAEFARVLKPDGALFFSTLGPDTLKELRQSWASVDNATHVNNFRDMHDYGDALLQTGLKNPVMDVDRIQLTYKDVYSLMKELKFLGAHNITAGRPRSLMGKGKFKAMIKAYEQFRSPEGLLPVTYEVVYGHALGKKNIELPAASPKSVAIPVSSILKSNNNV